MIKKLFHIADLHFRTYNRHSECKEVCSKFLSEVKKYIEDNNLSLINKISSMSTNPDFQHFCYFRQSRPSAFCYFCQFRPSAFLAFAIKDQLISEGLFGIISPSEIN